MIHLFILLLDIIATGLLYQFRLRKAITGHQVRLLVFPFVLLALIFLGNGILAYWLRPRLAYYVEATPIKTAEEIRNVRVGDRVLVIGKINLAPLKEDKSELFVDIQCSQTPCQLVRRSEAGFPILLDDGAINVVNDNYTSLNFQETLSSPSVAVVVAGILTQYANGGVLLKGNLNGTVNAEFIYAGDEDTFRAETQKNAVLPRILLVTSLVATVVVGLLLLAAWPEYG
jgi:hypothetical protein